MVEDPLDDGQRKIIEKLTEGRLIPRPILQPPHGPSHDASCDPFQLIIRHTSAAEVLKSCYRHVLQDQDPLFFGNLVEPRLGNLQTSPFENPPNNGGCNAHLGTDFQILDPILGQPLEGPLHDFFIDFVKVGTGADLNTATDIRLKRLPG